MRPSEKLRLYTTDEIPDHILEMYEREISHVVQKIVPIIKDYQPGIYLNAMAHIQAMVLRSIFSDSPEELEYAVEDVFQVFLERVYSEKIGSDI